MKYGDFMFYTGEGRQTHAIKKGYYINIYIYTYLDQEYSKPMKKRDF